MDIYKLSDSVPEEKKVGRRTRSEVKKATGMKQGLSDSNGQMIVTDLKQGLKNLNRVNVSVNGKYVFSLDVAQVVDFKLKIGKVISNDELIKYKEASEFGKEYQRALEWVLMRPRSVQELKEYLRKRELQGEAKERRREWDNDREIAELIAKGEEVNAEKLRMRRTKGKKTKYDFKDLIAQRLIERGYVDDQKFAEYYVENRFVKKGVSKKRLKMELMKKGIKQDVIDEVLNARNDEEELDKIIAKKRTKYSDEKLIQYLCRQGFSYELVKEKIHYSEMD